MKFCSKCGKEILDEAAKKAFICFNRNKVKSYPEEMFILKKYYGLDISYNTVATAVKKLVELGILQETTNAARNRVFAYEEYLGILRKDT